MKIGKIITIAILSFLLFQYQDIVLESMRVLVDLYPLIQTHLEMSAYSSQISNHIKENGNVPEDLSGWLEQNFDVKMDKTAGEDFFGRPYSVTEEDGEYIFRSCGRDGECFTDDDLIISLDGGINQS